MTILSDNLRWFNITWLKAKIGKLLCLYIMGEVPQNPAYLSFTKHFEDQMTFIYVKECSCGKLASFWLIYIVLPLGSVLLPFCCFLKAFPGKTVSLLLETGSMCSVFYLCPCFCSHLGRIRILHSHAQSISAPEWCEGIPVCSLSLMIFAYIIVEVGGQVECALKHDPQLDAFLGVWLGSHVSYNYWLIYFFFFVKKMTYWVITSASGFPWD